MKAADPERAAGLLQVIVACSHLKLENDKPVLKVYTINSLWLPAVYEALYGEETGKKAYQQRLLMELDHYPENK